MRVEDVDDLIHSDLDCKKEMLKCLMAINVQLSCLWDKLDDINISISDKD